jgi:hypothetical protein
MSAENYCILITTLSGLLIWYFLLKVIILFRLLQINWNRLSRHSRLGIGSINFGFRGG